jgi:RNA polymerase sigma factor (sigma-70 family)
VPNHPHPRSALESQLRLHHERALSYQDPAQAREELERLTALALRGYGKEILNWLTPKVGDRELASDLLQEACIGLWRGIQDFRWECEFRAWMYKLAFHALCNHARASSRKRRDTRMECRLESQELAAIGLEVTSLAGRLEKRSQLVEALSRIEEQDRVLIIQRQVTGEEDSWEEFARAWYRYKLQDEERLTAAAARLRQRYHRAMKELREIARGLGLAI